MLPAAPLMIEHRLIERMVALMKRQSEALEQDEAPDVLFLDAAVEFIRAYADRCHHGKEEGILFRDLRSKRLSPEHLRTMDELVAEHAQGRELTRSLVAARNRLVRGEHAALADLASNLKALVAFYPAHIEKEDRHFFLPVMSYFSAEERDRMLVEEQEYDRRLVHEMYGAVVGDWERRFRPAV